MARCRAEQPRASLRYIELLTRRLRTARGGFRRGAVLRRGARAYWKAAEGSPPAHRSLIEKLEFWTALPHAHVLARWPTEMDYKSGSGVDIDAGNETVRRIRGLARSTFTPGVLSDIGSFGGLFQLEPGRYREPVLVSSADGVGTKLKVAFMREPARHRRRRSREPLRQRHPRAGRRAAVLPRLPRDRAACRRTSPSRSSAAWRRRAATTAARCSAARRRRCPGSTPTASTTSPASSSASSIASG